ncbi:T9SS sorting signal type C domain-containing protein [Flavobacterium sp. ALD4]|uniref:T9SS sorting signal type C domain-containing protein n=1 Tax=Flavobacterium sp. ALD4 TaxID=2058314 RepID=UPI0012FEEE9A|nr:T9SS sorting signal type C domain-containing protein [Flavobacterium sp. ALD4]
MKQYYAKTTIFIINLIFSKIKNFKVFFILGNAAKKTAFVIFLILMHGTCFAQTITTLTSGNWSSSSTWAGGVVPGPNDIVTVNHAIILDVNLTIGTGEYTFNSNVTDDGSSRQLTAMTSGGVLIIANNSTTTFGGEAFLDNSVLTVTDGSTLITGTLTIDNGTSITINGTLEVNGNVTDNNNGKGGGFDVAGYVQINGNYNATVGNVQVDGSGVFQTTGTITTTGSSTVGDSTNNCTTGPCSSGSISCENNTSSISPSNQSLCADQSVAPLIFSSNSAISSYQWQKSTTNGGLGFTDIGEATSNTYSPGFIDGTTWYRIKYSKSENGCANLISPSVKVTIVSNSAPTFALGDIVQPTCVQPTGSVFLSGLPAGTWTLTRSPGDVVTGGSGTTMSIDGLVAGTYNFTVRVDDCESVPSANIEIVAPVSAIWDGTEWTNGPPTINKVLVFEGNYSENVDVEGCACEVKAGTVVIPNGKSITITNDMVVSGGSLIFKNNASLVQVNDAADNSGNITYNRAVTGIKAKDYVYWSTPVRGQKLADFSSTIKYLWNAKLNSWRVPGLLDMQICQGYTIRRDVAGNFTKTFTGIPNNGIKDISIGDKDSFNLIGNPYPSAIDADKFLLEDNNKLVLGGTIYFWTHITPITLRDELPAGTAGSGDLAYTSDDYASYNITGGVGVEKGTKAKSDNNVGEIRYKPTGKIAAGQAFFATSIASGKKAVFKNSMRVGADDTPLDNSQFFKIKSNSKTSNTIEKTRVWLNLTNTGGAFKQTLIGYITGATNEYDNVYDGISFDGNTYIDFYSTSKDKNFVIQGRALPFDDNDKVPLGYKTTIVGEFKIAIDETDGLLVNKIIYLEDKLLGKTQDLSLAPYTFTTEKGTYNDRFVLSYTNKTLVTDDFKDLNYGVLISNKNREIKINALVNYIDKVFVYDITGKQIFSKSKIDKNEFIMSNLESSNQVLIVKVLLQNNIVVTKKVLF